MTIERVGPVALAVCILGAFVNGLTDPWLLIVAACATYAVRREVRFAGLHQFRRSFVAAADLDDVSSQRLQAVQFAVDTVCASEVYQTGRLDRPLRAAHLRQYELDLVAATAADEHAITELAHLTDDAAQARDAYQAALDRAMQAASPLALSLPD